MLSGSKGAQEDWRGEVESDHRLDVRLGQVIEVPGTRVPGIVDRQIDPTTLLGSGCHARGCSRFGYAGREDLGAAADVAHHVCGLLRNVRSTANLWQIRVPAPELNGQGTAAAAAHAGDDAVQADQRGP